MDETITVKQPHQFTNKEGKVLILRRISKSRISHQDFKWPEGIGIEVSCPDWDPKPVCGGGLHGWPWGFGIGEGSDFDFLNDIWLVLSAAPKDVVGALNEGWKCKVRTAIKIFEGDFTGAFELVREGFESCIKQMASGSYSNLAASGSYSKLAASGSNSNLVASGFNSDLATSGSYSKLAASGSYSKLAASGSYSKLAASGSYSNLAASGSYSDLAASGSYSNLAASGSYSDLATSGSNSNLVASGSYSNLAASGSNSNLVASGSYSNLATSGSYSKLAASGSYSKLAASGSYIDLEASGNDSVCAISNMDGRVKVGERGAFAIAFWDDDTGYQFVTGKVGTDGIKANIWYEVKEGRLVESLNKD